MAIAALIVVGLGWRQFPLHLTGPLLLLILAAVVSENFALALPGMGSASLSYSLAIAGAVLYGPAGASAIAVFSGVNYADIRDRRDPVIFLFNTSQVLLTASVSAWVYVLLGGPVLSSGEQAGLIPLASVEFLGAIVPLLAGALAGVVLNGALVGLGLHYMHGVHPVEVWKGFARFAPTQIALAVVGFTIAEVLAINWLGFVFFVFPLLVARGVYARYAELKEAYADTVRFFVGFLDAKDAYTRGHSERVAKYAVEIGECAQLPGQKLERLEYAALLHDMGKVKTPSYVLNKPGRLTDEEFALIKEHPQAGAEMVSRIPYLRDLSDLVAAHHEALDGSGYGEGLKGEEIPPLARILAVADAYDAMTSERPYRSALSHDEACAELRRCAGSQFDHEVVLAWLGTESESRHLQVGLGQLSPAAGE
jgi:putative nucleotidyltransferase with HDIG domain